MIKIYFDDSHYNKKFRGQLFPLLKPFVKNENYTDEERIEAYGISEKDVEFVERIEETEVVVLTMSWDYYIQHDNLDLANELITDAAKWNIKVWTVSLGDIGYKLPFYKHVRVFRASGFKSKLPKTHCGMPVFIADPLQIYFNTKSLIIPEYTGKPIIGFCGYANGSKFEVLKFYIKTLIKLSINALKSNPYEFDPVYVAAYERFKLLKQLESARGLVTNFIYRSRYRAGANTPVIRKQTTLEYFDNMKHSQYVLCVRGAGNFSVRFYETLAMGRIPVLVNTDCLLPLPEIIDWKKHVVWLEQKDIKNIKEKVLNFHNDMTPKEFKNLQQANRTLWEESLTLGGYFKTCFDE